MSDSVRPHIDGSPPGSPVPGILQARTLEWVAISFSNAWKVKMKSLSRVRLLATPWTAAYQAPPSMGFSRQEYWSGVPLPSPLYIYIAVCVYVNEYNFLFLYWSLYHPHSSTLAWKIPRTEEPGRLQSTGSLRVGHDWSDLAAVAAAAAMPYFVFLYGLCFKIYFFLLWVLLPQLSCHFHLHGIFFQPSLLVSVCLALNWVSCRQQVDSFFIQSATLWFFIETLIFNGI